MSDPLILSYTGVQPSIGAGARLVAEAAIIGRVEAGERLTMGRLATVRADGHYIHVGSDCSLAERATLHIADNLLPCVMGDQVTVGRYALVHACTVDDGCVIGDAAVVMDGARVGPGAVIAAGALVPPRKQLPGGWLYSGSPCQPIRQVDADELGRLRQALINGDAATVVNVPNLPPLGMDPYRPVGAGRGPLYALASGEPRIDTYAYVAPTAVIVGNVTIAREASVWFATVVSAEGARVTIGERANIQDNCILETDARRGPIILGNDATIGHNVCMGACVVEDEALIGMGAQLGDGVVVERGACVGARAWVEPSTIVKAGYIWAGRPAREFRKLRPDEEEFFRFGKEAYITYTHAYLTEPSR